MKINVKVFSKKLFASLIGLASIFAVTSCSSDDTEEPAVSVSPVVFSVENDTQITYSSTITATTETEDASIVWSLSPEFSTSNFKDMIAERTAWETGRSYGLLELKKDAVTPYLTEGKVTVYAFAYIEEKNAFSSVTNVTLVMVNGPETPVITAASGTQSGDKVKAGEVLTITSEYLDNEGQPIEGVKIYVSTAETLTALNWSTKGTLVSDGTYTLENLGSVTVSAIAVYEASGSVLCSAEASVSYTVEPAFAPLASSVAEGTEGAGNYELDGGIQAFVDAVNGSTSDVTVNMTLKGYVTMIYNVKDGNQWLGVQDKDNAVELYFGNKKNFDMSAFYLGQYVEFAATCGQVYNNVLEVKNTVPADVSFDKSKDTPVLYYNVLNGKTDFSGLETFKLSAIKCNPDSDNYSDTKPYKNPLSVVYTKETLSEGETAKAFFGYVAQFDSGKTLELSVIYSKPASAMTDAASTLVNTVELPFTNHTAISETSAELLLTDTVELLSVTEGVTFKYSFKGDDDEEFGSEIPYTSPIEFDKTYEALNVKVTAEKNGYNSCERIFTFKVQDIDGDIFNVGALTGLTDKADISGSYELTDSVVTFDKGTNSTTPKWYTTVARIYGSNTVSVSAAKKTIKKITFKWAASNTPAEGTWIPDCGTYNYETKIWTAPADSEVFDVVFTYNATSGNIQLSQAIIEYNEKEFLEPVTFSSTSGEVDSGTVVTLSTASDGADIYYSTETVLTNSNYTTAGTNGTSITVNNAVTVYAIAVSGDLYSKCTSASYEIKSTTPAALVESIAADDVVVIYNTTDKGNFALTGTASGTKLAGEAVTPENNVFSVSNGMLQLTVEIPEAGKYRFKSGDKYLTAYINTSNNNKKTLSLSTLGEDTSTATWTLSPVDGTSGAYVVCTVAESPIYLEYYSGFSAYSSGSGDAFNMYFYKVGLSESTVE